MMQRVWFIYNPASGEGVIPERLDELVELHQKHGCLLLPYRLGFLPDQDAQLLSAIDPKCRHVLVAGGDGTVNYVVNLLKKNGLDVPLAVLPTGTANDFASLFDLPSDPVKACEKLLTGQVRRIDLGLVNGDYFANVFSCGLFSDISQRTPTIFKNTFGRLAYYVSGISDLPKFRLMHLKVSSDGGDYEGPALMFFVFNGRTAGKLPIAYLSQVDDGLLDVLIIKGDNPGENLQGIFHYMTLVRRNKEYPSAMVHIRCTRLLAESSKPEATDMDGQAGPALPVQIACLKGGLQVLAPKPKAKKKKGSGQ